MKQTIALMTSIMLLHGMAHGQVGPTINPAGSLVVWVGGTTGIVVGHGTHVDKTAQLNLFLQAEVPFSDNISLCADIGTARVRIERDPDYEYHLVGWAWLLPIIDEQLVDPGLSEEVNAFCYSASLRVRSSAAAVVGVDLDFGFDVRNASMHNVNLSKVLPRATIGLNLRPRESPLRFRIMTGMVYGSLSIGAQLGVAI